jgi:hypothetical protein
MSNKVKYTKSRKEYNIPGGTVIIKERKRVAWYRYIKHICTYNTLIKNRESLRGIIDDSAAIVHERFLSGTLNSDVADPDSGIQPFLT